MTIPKLFPSTLMLTAFVAFGAGYARQAKADKR